MSKNKESEFDEIYSLLVPNNNVAADNAEKRDLKDILTDAVIGFHGYSVIEKDARARDT